VTVDMVVANLTQNARMAQQVIANAVERLPIERSCECASALATAILTRRDAIPDEARHDLWPIVGKYLK
jgi:5'-methylthioadenosine phosphorylase